LRVIRQLLESLAENAHWEHNQKYRTDDDGELRNCSYCRHFASDETRYQAGLNYGSESWCNLDTPDNLDENGFMPKHDTHEICRKWERVTPY
jgi:CRISPR/Cas system CSM-associated protein Csm3 (group 7 of RAMP superfamily)